MDGIETESSGSVVQSAKLLQEPFLMTEPMPDLFLDNVSLERVQYFKYLGILLAADLRWTHHIEPSVARHVNCWDYSTINSMKMPIHQPSDSSICIKLVRPHLEYECHIWDLNLQKDKHL